MDMVSEMNIDLIKAGAVLSEMPDVERASGLRSLRFAPMLNVHAGLLSTDKGVPLTYLCSFRASVSFLLLNSKKKHCSLYPTLCLQPSKVAKPRVRKSISRYSTRQWKAARWRARTMSGLFQDR